MNLRWWGALGLGVLIGAAFWALWIGIAVFIIHYWGGD